MSEVTFPCKPADIDGKTHPASLQISQVTLTQQACKYLRLPSPASLLISTVKLTLQTY